MAEKIEIDRHQVRTLLLYEFRLKHTAVEATRNICGAMGEGTVSYHTAKEWFQKFKNGDFNLDEGEHSGRPVELDESRLLELIEDDPRRSLRELEELLDRGNNTICRHLHRLGKVSKLGVWIPHELSASQAAMRVNVCMQLLTFKRTFDWLRNLVTGDEKWVLYVNHTRKRQWLSTHESGVPTPKADLHPKKVMISVWWSVKGIVHWELLPRGLTLTADYYCAQLDRVADELRGKQEKVFLLHDNAKPHVAKRTCQKIKDLRWTILPHPPYSPDLSPTDYHLFRSLSHFLKDRHYDDEDHLKNDLQNFFTSRSPEFYCNGIMKLPDKWQEVVDADGAYLI